MKRKGLRVAVRVHPSSNRFLMGDRSIQPSSNYEWVTALRILRHLAQNPDSGDTAAGILSWWLPQQRILEEKHAISQALRLLQHDGWIIRTHLTESSDPKYRLNTGRLEEIRKILNAGELV